MTPLPMVRVTWLDAHTIGGWMKTAEYRDLAGKASAMLTESVGYLLARTRQSLTIIQSVSPENNTMADSITIPAGCIKSVRRLHE